MSIKCKQCGGSPTTLKRCSNCKVVHYCNRNCQTRDWKYHKQNCSILEFTSPDQDEIMKLMIEKAKKWLDQKQFSALIGNEYYRQTSLSKKKVYIFLENSKESSYSAHMKVYPLDASTLIIKTQDGKKKALHHLFRENLRHVDKKGMIPVFYLYDGFPHAGYLRLGNDFKPNDQIKSNFDMMRDYHKYISK